MWFEPRPPLTREAEKLGANCQHWLPFTHFAYGHPLGHHHPRHGPPSARILAAQNPTAVEASLAALTASEGLLILAISPASVSEIDGAPYFTLTVLYQELLTPQGNSVADEGGDDQ